MLMELTVIPFARAGSLSSDLAELIGPIDESRRPHKITEFGTVVEGSWEELIATAKACHLAIRNKTDRVLMLIRLDDHADPRDLLSTAIAHMERHLGQHVRTDIPPAIRLRFRAMMAFVITVFLEPRENVRSRGWQML